MKTIQYTIPDISSVTHSRFFENSITYNLSNIQIQQLLDLLEPLAEHSPAVDQLLTDIFES